MRLRRDRGDRDRAVAVGDAAELWSPFPTEPASPVDVAALAARIEALEARADAQQAMLAQYVVAADQALQTARLEIQHDRSADQRAVFGLFDELLRSLAEDFGLTRQPVPLPPPSDVTALPAPVGPSVPMTNGLRIVEDCDDGLWLAAAV